VSQDAKITASVTRELELHKANCKEAGIEWRSAHGKLPCDFQGDAAEGAGMSTDPSPSPLVPRRRLRTELRRARAEVRLTQDQVASAMDWSLSKVIRIENGAVSISTNDLRALLDLYRIGDRARVDDLVELAKASRQPSWWGRHRGVLTPQYLQYIEYEEAATVLRSYQSILLPGLLQTEEYAASIIRKLAPSGTPAELMRTQVEVRRARQRILEQPDPPVYVSLLDEAVIQHIVGERKVADGQLARLIELATRPNVTIEIVPFTAGLYNGILQPFLHLEFPDPEDADVVFLESATRDTLLSDDDAGEVTGFRELFEAIRSMSMGPARTLAHLTNLAR
jgi:transcriptional regulator with XRE-family HTH domain